MTSQSSPANTHVAADTAYKPAEGLRELIAACIRGERKQQKALYDTYAPQIYGTIRRYVASEFTAQEILNEAFYRILTRLEQYAFQGAFEGWMRRIAVHAITDAFRKEQKHGQVGELSATEEEISATTDALGKLSYKELLAHVHGLPDTQRTVFNLFVFEQYAHKGIAGLLGITENNSRWQLNDARRRLREKITAAR